MCLAYLATPTGTPEPASPVDADRFYDRVYQGVCQPISRIGDSMPQTYKSGDRVVITTGPDAERAATVVDNFQIVYGDDLTDGALVRFDDGEPSKAPVAGQTGVEREFRSTMLRPA